MHLKISKDSTLRIALVISFLLPLTLTGFAQKKTIDIGAFNKETQKTPADPNRTAFVCWIPEEYWEITLSSDPSYTPEAMERFLQIFRPYTVFAVMDGKITERANTVFKSEEEIRKDIVLIDKDGVSYTPISADKIDEPMKDFLRFMKPSMAISAGEFGSNSHYVLFPAKNKLGKQIASATKEGTFSIKLGDLRFDWNLPLNSLLSPKKCPVDNEEMNGAWKYCPWHGEKLISIASK